MRKIFGLIVVLSALFVASCEKFEDDRVDHSQIYGAFVDYNSATREYSMFESNKDTLFIRVNSYVPLYEDIELEFELGGTGVFEKDFKVVSEKMGRGEVKSFDATKAVVLLKHDRDLQDNDRAILCVVSPIDDLTSEDDKLLTIKLVKATSVSGKTLNIGRFNTPELLTITLMNFDVIPGTYKVTSNLASASQNSMKIELVKRSVSTDVNRYKISNILGSTFNVQINWLIDVNVKTGEVVGAPSDDTGFGVTANLTGSYDLVKGTFDIDFKNCNYIPFDVKLLGVKN